MGQERRADGLLGTNFEQESGKFFENIDFLLSIW